MTPFDSTDELLEQIRLGEDSSLELKELRFRGQQVSAPHRQSMADELAAMANTRSGVFVLGVDDRTRAVQGIALEQLDAAETWLRGICNDLITPPLLCTIRKLRLPDESGELQPVIRVDVPRSLHVHQSPGGYFHRVGSSKRSMPPEVLARLFQQRSQARLIRFDEQPVPMAGPDALSRRLWERFKTPLSPADDGEFLTKLGLLSRGEDGALAPSVAGLLMCSEHPQEHLPNAFIQAVAYRGLERNARYQLDARDIEGPADEQISGALHFVRRNMRVGATKTPARVDIPQFSLDAVFEAVVNAVAHRDYSIYGSKIRLHLFEDRLELFSPGAIPNTMTIESLPLRQATRNELLTSLLARCPVASTELTGLRTHLMDRRGEGVPIILSESASLSGIEPQYRLIDESELLLTIYAASPPSGDGVVAR